MDDTLSLRVIVAGPGEHVITLTNLAPTLSLAHFRTLLASQLPNQTDAHRVPTARLIYSGRVLTSPDATLGSLNIPTNSTLHLVFSSATAPGGGGGGPPAMEDAGSLGGPTGGGHRGFDRLLAMGMDAEGVSVLRSLFLTEAIEQMGPVLPLQPNETESSRVLRLEDAWMGMQGENSDFAHNIRPFLRRMRGVGGMVGGAGGQRMGGMHAWMLHPMVQNAMLSARAQGASDVDAVRIGFAVHQRLVGGGGRGGDGGGGGEGGGMLPPGEPGGGGGPGGGPGGPPTMPPTPTTLGGSLVRLVSGLLVGTFLGWMSVFFLLNTSTNRVFKAGVIIGVVINIIVISISPQDPTGGSSGGGGGGGTSGGRTPPGSPTTGVGGGVWGNPNDSPWAQAVEGHKAVVPPPGGGAIGRSGGGLRGMR